jgi:hypothetical protein
MKTEILPLRLPRLMTGIANRCREVERIAVLNAVPVGILHADPSEAPVTFRMPDGTEHRAIDGLAYMPFVDPKLYRPLPGKGFEAEWAAALDRLTPYVAHQTGLGNYVDLNPFGDVQKWSAHLSGASRKRGIRPADGVPMREIHDEGRGPQAEAAATMAGRLAMVGDVLMVRTDLPRTSFGTIDTAIMRQTADPMSWRHDGPFGKPFDADDFRIDRPEEAEAFAALLAARGRKVVGSPRVLEIVDAEALAACYDRACPERAFDLVALGHGMAESMAYELAEYPEREIARYLSLRTMVRERDGDGIRDWMEGAEATRDLLARFPTHKPNAEYYGKSARRAMDRALLRYREIECPKLDFSSEDALALGALRGA